MESKYARLAVDAAEGAAKGNHPLMAWKSAAERIFPNSPSSQSKGCPKSAFLGLAETGQIIGIPAGDYTRSEENKRYAISALRILRNNKHFSPTPEILWSKVIEEEGTEKQHNSQMDVVMALWKAKKFVGQSA